MASKKKWFEDGNFWVTTFPLMFSKARLENSANEVEKLITMLDIAPGSNILDLCCGVGRLSIEFAKHNFSVTGVDITKAYLNIAKKNAGKTSKIKFIQSDMRAFSKPNSFDVIVNMFTSFGYFEDPKDDIKVLKNCFISLKPGGKIIIELLGKEILASTGRFY